jgi:hypothetical protein
MDTDEMIYPCLSVFKIPMNIFAESGLSRFITSAIFESFHVIPSFSMVATVGEIVDLDPKTIAGFRMGELCDG